MTPFVYRTDVIDMDSKDKQGFLLVKGREDGSWSIHLHHWSRESAGCDTPEACYPSLLQIITEWWSELERRHKEGLAVIHSWPEKRRGYRPGWKRKELAEVDRALRKTAAAWVIVRDQIKQTMSTAGWEVRDNVT